MSSLVSAAFERIHAFLLEPAPGSPYRRGPGGRDLEPMPAPVSPAAFETFVLGLSGGCGVTTIARGLAATLAVPGLRQAHVVALGAPGAEPMPLAARLHGGGRQWDVPAGLASPDEVAEYGATVARLAGGTAALVWDVPAAAAVLAAVAARSADAGLVVAPEGGEPALAELASDMLRSRFGPLLLVANRVRDRDRWAGRAAVAVPQSRLGALLAARGRRPAGAFAAAFAELAALVEERGRLQAGPLES